jgi:SSS family solute:Na+ symporter
MAGLDYGIIGLYVCLIIWIGASFAKRQTTSAEYFLISRSVPWWAVCFTVVATETSTLTFIGVPAQTYAAGGNLTFLQLALGYIAGRFIVSAVFIPRYFARELLTSYEVLHERFGAPVRNLGSAMFLVTRSAADGIRLFATSAVVATLVGVPIWAAILVLGIAMIVYTFYGGASAVIWTDVLQMFVYLAGALIVLWFALAGIPGGVSEVIDFGAVTGRFTMFNLNLDFFRPYTFWAGMVGGVALTLATHGTDQFLVQRLLTARSREQAQVGLSLSGILVFLQFALFLFIGVALATFYQHAGAPVLSRGDMLIPTFVRDHVPPGFAGFVVAAIVAAALSPSINSLAATTVNDFYLKYWKPEATEPQILRIAHRATIGWGVVQIGIALLATRLNQSVLDAGLSVLGLGAGPVLGAFLVAVMKRRVQPWPVALAMLVAWVTVWSVWSFTSVAWPWYAAIGATVTVLLSLGSSLLLQARQGTTAVLILATIGAAGCSAFGVSGCGQDQAAENTLTGAIEVSTVPARMSVLRRSVSARGTVSPMADGDLIVHATETSTVAEMPLEEGSPVKVGDVIVRFEVPSRVAAIQTAEVEIAQAMNRVETARARVAQLSGMVERGLTPRMELDSAKTELASAETEVALQRATLAATKQAEDRSTIRARFDGVVMQRWHFQGDTVLGTGTDPVIRVIDPTRVQVTVDVPMSELGLIVVGQRATIAPMGSMPMEATVSRVLSAASPDALTAQVMLAFPQDSVNPPAGTAVQAEILIAELPDALVVPSGAIIRGDGAPHVLVAGADNRAVRRDVGVGMITPDLTQITQGLAAGDVVITSALTEIKEGALVSLTRGQ